MSAFHSRLRAATQDAHQRLEDAADILDRVVASDSRRDVVERFYQLHAAIEIAAAPWLEGLAGLDFRARRRTEILARDLEVLGVAAPRRVELLRVDGVGQALGLLYVTEGSTLGGQVIERHVRAQGADLQGLEFLTPYGDRVGQRWRDFLTVIDGVAPDPSQADAVIAGALRGFALAERQLCGVGADV